MSLVRSGSSRQMRAAAGCHCPDCDASRARRRRRNKLTNLGRGPYATEQECRQALERVAELRSAGMSLRLLAEAVGCSSSTAAGWSRGARDRMHRDHYEAVMAVRWNPAALSGENRNRGTPVGPDGVRRRCRALYALGFPYKWQSARLGLRGNGANDWARGGTKTFTYYTYLEVCDLYEKWQDRDPVADGGVTPYVAARCRRDAQRKGFAPPIAWDDDTIDDPAALPNVGGQWAAAEDVDEVAVQRALDGRPVALTQRERREVMRRLVDSLDARPPLTGGADCAVDPRTAAAAEGLGVQYNTIKKAIDRVRAARRTQEAANGEED